MARYIGIPILALAAILNATVMAEIRVGNGAPDLVFLLVISWALLVSVQDAMVWAVIGGVFQDMFSVAPLGTSALGLVIVAFLADAAFGQISRRNLLIPPLVAAVGTVIYHAGVLVALQMVSIGVPLSAGLLYVTLPTVVFNTVLMLPVFRLVGQVHYWLTPRRVRLD
ncbi:MAG: rod shape-determining protein MreD [Anaerolineae bacterium]|nr:rod shape-determining protein MreD [Anaerolineae bacterium]